jgi:Putative threonine/serine exporter
MTVVPPLALFLPGVLITLATIELTTQEIVSGSARLAAGAARLAQLAFGILVAAQITGVTASDLIGQSVNQLGWWAPWTGVVVYALGVMLHNGPPAWFLPWLLAILFITYLSQVVADTILGGYASGFGGGFASMMCSQFLSRRPNSPPIGALVTPGSGCSSRVPSP